jgi:RING-like zinc finger
MCLLKPEAFKLPHVCTSASPASKTQQNFNAFHDLSIIHICQVTHPCFAIRSLSILVVCTMLPPVLESRMPVQEYSQTNIASYVGDETTHDLNVNVAIIAPLISVLCGMLFLLLAIFLGTKIRRTNNQSTTTTQILSRPQRGTKGTLQVLSVAALGSIPIIKFNGGDHTDGRADEDLELGFVSHNAITQATAIDTVVKHRSGSSSESDTDSPRPHHAGSARPTTNQQRQSAREADRTTSGGHHHPSWSGMSISCSICNEDFEHGHDVRVLPCNHSYPPPVSIRGSSKGLQLAHYGKDLLEIYS